MTNPYTTGLRIGDAGEETDEQRAQREKLEETDRKLRQMAELFGPPGGGFHEGASRNPYTPSHGSTSGPSHLRSVSAHKIPPRMPGT